MGPTFPSHNPTSWISSTAYATLYRWNGRVSQKNGNDAIETTNEATGDIPQARGAQHGDFKEHMEEGTQARSDRPHRDMGEDMEDTGWAHNRGDTDRTKHKDNTNGTGRGDGKESWTHT